MSPTFHICSVWGDDRLAPDDIGKRVLQTLQRLEPLAPVMRNWAFLDRRSARGIPLARASSRMTALVESNVIRDDAGEPTEVVGYRIHAYGWEVPETWDARTVRIDFHAGSKWSSEIDFQIGDVPFPGDIPLPTDFSVVTYPVFKGALEAFAAVWPLPWALAHAFDLETRPIDAASGNGVRRSPFEGAWIAYLSAPLADGLAVPPEIASERTPGGGLVLTALGEPVDRTKPDDMRRSRLLERIMLERVGVQGTNRSGRPAHPARKGPY